MLRRIVICTPYLRSDTSRAALRLADLLRMAGNEVLIGVTSQRADRLHPYWDSMLIENPWNNAYGPDDCQIWFVPPPMRAQLVNTVREIPYYVVHNHHFEHQIDFGAYSDARRVIYPDVGSYWRFKKYVVLEHNAELIQWDIGSVLCRNSDNDTRPASFLLPLHDMYYRQVHPGCMYAFAAAAKTRRAMLILTVPRRLPPPWRRAIKTIKKQHPFVQTLPVENEIIERDIFSSVDCVLWPGYCDAFGTITQASLYAGTPVVSWFDSPHVDIVRHRSNGMLVNRGEDFQASLLEFVAAVRQLALDWDFVASMRDTAHAGLQSRQAEFVTRWLDLLRV